MTKLGGGKKEKKKGEKKKRAAEEKWAAGEAVPAIERITDFRFTYVIVY